MSSAANIVVFLIALPVAGMIAAFLLGSRSVLSGRLAVAFSLLPISGVGLALAFC